MPKKTTKKNLGGRPPHPDGPAGIVTASMPQDMIDALDAWRDERGLSRSGAVVEAVRKLTKFKSKKKKKT